MTVPQSTLCFTAKDGSEAQITGDVGALDALETILKNAGVTYNRQVGCWDAGYYEPPFEPDTRIVWEWEDA